MTAFSPEQTEWGTTYLQLNSMFKLRVETNIKLQLIDMNGNPLISPERVADKEIHFIQMEALND